MMSRVAISQRVIENETYVERRDALSQDWARYLTTLIPSMTLVPIPNRLVHVTQWLEALSFDALVLSNGNDWGAAPERDRLETEAFVYFRSRGLPILGACRGLQVINVLLQGTLVSDLSGLTGASHVACTHDVVLEEGPFRTAAGSSSLTVNSYHDQAVLLDGLARELRPFAVAEGGVVEGLHHSTDPILGIQWHPERDNPAAGYDAQLIQTFLSRGAFWVQGA
jgi:N5-(cytidine 5'-diphosphoramidyl)-L-glutamine hydrolase